MIIFNLLNKSYIIILTVQNNIRKESMRKKIYNILNDNKWIPASYQFKKYSL